MSTSTRPPKRPDNIISSLDVAIEVLNITKEALNLTPAKVVVCSVSALLVMIRDSMANEADYVALGLTCAEICTAIKEGMDGKREREFNGPVRKAIDRLERTVKKIESEIKSKTESRSKLRVFLRSMPRAKNEKEVIAGWNSDLNIILGIFNTQLSINTHVIVSDVDHNVSDIHHNVSELRRDVSVIRHDVSQIRGRSENQTRSTQVRAGESPPPAPRALFGRDELVEKITGLVDSLTPIALIGAGGIGKTSIALTILHQDPIKERFGDDRRFIRCDQFPATRTHFLRRLSRVIGASVNNPEDLSSLRPFLSSKEMVIVLDNAESILDPQGMDAQGVYGVVEELSQFSNICLFVTSRISTVPPDCRTLDTPTLSMEAARDSFYRIYEHDERSDLVDDVLKQLDFHPLSIALLATVAHHNKWNVDRLTREWETRRIDVLHTHHNKSLAAAIELSLASPMFQDLGPDALDLLEVVAFFPRGVDENNLDWLFPTIHDRTNVFDRFSILSLTYQNNGFTTMLAPLRDYLHPKDPRSSPLLCAAKDRYFSRLSLVSVPHEPGFEETRWITSEDVNVEHLLDVFTSVDTNSIRVWGACADFMRCLSKHKPWLVMLKPKIEGLPDHHPSKPRCLFELSRLSASVVNFGMSELRKRCVVRALELWRQRGDVFQVARTLRHLARANRRLGLHAEGILQGKAALGIYKQLNDQAGQAKSLECLALLFTDNNQLEAAEEAVSRAINLSSGGPRQPRLYQYHHILAHICHSRGDTEAAVRHSKAALRIASSLDSRDKQVSILRCLASLLLQEERFDDIQTHIEHLKSRSVNDPFNLGAAMVLQAYSWFGQGKFEEAKSEALHAISVYEGIGARDLLAKCKELLKDIEKKMINLVTSVNKTTMNPNDGGPPRYILPQAMRTS